MVGILIHILVVVLIAGVILWVLDQFSVEPHLRRIVRVVVIVLAAIAIIMAVAGLGDGMFYRGRL